MQTPLPASILQPRGATDPADEPGRSHNERLILSLIRVHGPLSKADIARLGGFSSQTSSVLIRKLEEEGFLMRGDPVKGRIGQPSVPMALDPSGACSLGMRIGRRSADMMMIDLTGAPTGAVSVRYAYPTPDRVLEFVRKGIESLTGHLTPDQRARLVGIGLGVPFQLYNWLDRLGAPIAEMNAWRDFDLGAAVLDATGLMTIVENDATCACRAEHLVGRGRSLSDYAYFYIGYFIGGGIVLDNAVRNGSLGNAGALGALPARGAGGGDGRQLIDTASLFVLEGRLKNAGIDPALIWTQRRDWSSAEPHLTAWCDETAAEIAHAVSTACCVLDFPAVVIDGAFPPAVRAMLVERTMTHLKAQPLAGIIVPEIQAGSVGFDARALGAASLPLFSRYFLEDRLAA